MNCVGRSKLMHTVFAIVSTRYFVLMRRQGNTERNGRLNLTMDYLLKNELRMAFATNI